jgi:GT2 family glycosyltransferase
MKLGSEMGLKKTIYTKLIGEDMSFCYRLQKEGYDIWVDPSVQIGHASIEVIR